MDINPDFRTRLRNRLGDDSEQFELLGAGGYWMSIRRPEIGSLNLPPTRALEDYDSWKVAIYAADGTATTPSTHPGIFQERLWRRYWIDGPQAPSVPTEVVQTLYDFLVLGPERYEEMTTLR